MAVNELEPCPFCGRGVDLWIPLIMEQPTIYCDNCGIYVTIFKDKFDIVRKWNTRAHGGKVATNGEEIITRCKDCEYFHNCEFHEYVTRDPNGYCAWGVARNGGE